MSEPAQLSPLKRAYLALQKAEARIAELESGIQEPIAIVGIGCRMPGPASNPEEYWSVLEAGRNTISKDAPERWKRLGAPSANEEIAEAAKYAALIDDVEHFEPQFFGISPREAMGMDPQQRLLLETSWEALEHGAIAPASLHGTKTGVYFALCTSDYQQIEMGSSGLGAIDPHFASGIAHSIASGRIAYVLGLLGPAITVDTACSSSLVAVHLACQGLRNRDCDVALSGGINLILTPEPAVMYHFSGMLAPDGQCKAFDKRADGFVRGEGCGVVALKRLSDALAANNRILAVIRGIAINQDGPSSGLTAPNGTAQRALIRQALANSGVKPSQIGYVEAHGTGTSLGDPIEAQALGAELAEGREPARPLLIGSVKTNIGHLEGAAGIAGLIKTVLSLERRQIPAQLHAAELNPFIPWESLPLRVVRELTPWEPIDGRRIGGVSAFGFSGTNVHVVVEEAPQRAVEAPKPDRPLQLLCLSARTPTALREVAARYASHLRGGSADRWEDICHTANVGRSHFAHRLSLSAATRQEAADLLEVFVKGEESPQIVPGVAHAGSRPHVAFLFTGQGAQFAGMGKQLYASCAQFRSALDECERILKDQLEVPLGAVIRGEHPGADQLINQTLYTQPALFAFEYALAQAWKSWGVEPGLAAGHSLGEYVACVTGGVMDLASGLNLVARRARLMHEIREDGAMVAVEATEEEARAAFRGNESRVSVAAVNGPLQVVLTGYRESVEAAVAKLAAKGRRTRALRVSQAFHSPILDRISGEFQRVASEVKYSAPHIRLLSNVTGGEIEPVSAGYWTRQMRQPVLFQAQVETLRKMGYGVVVEIGPKPVLIGLAKGCLADPSWGTWIPSLRGDGDDWKSIAGAVQQLYRAGVDIDWSGWDKGFARRCVSLPTYPFERQRYWTAHNSASRPPKSAGTPVAHPLLGVRLASPLDGAQFESWLSPSEPGLEWISGHRIGGRVIFPATGFLEAMLAGGAEAHGKEWNELREVSFIAPLQFDGEARRRIQVIVDGRREGEARVRFFSASEEGWTLHAEGTIASGAAAPQAAEDLAAIRSRCPMELTGASFYESVRSHGADFGEGFQRLERIWHASGEGLASVRIGESDAAWRVHPAALDAGLQAGAGVICGADGLCMPASAKGYRQISTPNAGTHYSHLLTRPAGESGFDVSLRLFDQAGAPVAEIQDLRLMKLREGEASDAEIRNWFYCLDWKKSPVTPQWDQPDTATLLISEPPGKDAIADRLEATFADQGREVLRLERNAAALSAGLEKLGKREARILYFSPPHATPETSATAQRAVIEDLNGLVSALGKAPEIQPRIYFISRNAWVVGDSGEGLAASGLAEAALVGAVSALAMESPEFRCTRLDVDGADPADATAGIAAELFSGSSADWAAWRKGTRFEPRLRRMNDEVKEPFASSRNPVRLVSGEGGLEGLKWEAIERREPGPQEVEVRVHAAALNFHDVLTALGVLTDPDPLGAECSGVVMRVGSEVQGIQPGDKVIALAGGCFGTFVTTTANLVTPLPAGLSFEAAAAQPMAYLTADFCLNEVAKIKRGERVLIHAATGGVGLAAVSLCQRAGAEIFATAGNDEKRSFLRAMGVQHVMDSRSPDFARQIRAVTGGEGVDAVLNSLAGELIDASLSVLGRGGRFIELGKTDLRDPEQVRKRHPGVFYKSIYLTEEIDRDPVAMMYRLRGILKAIAAGELKELPAETFPLEEAAGAFRRMAMARHKGKIVLRCGEAELVPVRTGGAYVVTGGLTGLGLEVARWLASQGAGSLVLAGRRAPSPKTEEILSGLRDAGVSVTVVNRDVADEEGAREILAAAGDRIRGIVHCAGVYDDAPMTSLTWDRFEKVLRPKAGGAWNLHALSLDLSLDFFVLFSSWASVGGSPGQANYCAANAYLDALAHYRRSLGLPALSVNWGGWGQTGFAASGAVGKRLASLGVKLMQPSEALRCLDLALRRTLGPQIAIGAVSWPRFLASQTQSRIPALYRDFESERGPEPAAPSGPPKLTFAARLENALPAKRSDEILTGLSELAAKVLGLSSAAQIDPQQPLKDYGMDSLIAVELRNSLCAALGRPVPPTALFDHPSLSALSHFVEKTLFPGETISATAVRNEQAADPSGNLLDRIEQLSDEEVDRLFAAAGTAPSPES